MGEGKKGFTMSILTGRKAYLPLEENKAYKVKLTGWTERVLEQPTETGTIAFLTFKWELQEDKRIVNDTRSFPTGTDILAQQLLIQLNNKEMNAMEQVDLFERIANSTIEVDMWIERKSNANGTFTNCLFREPKPQGIAVASTTQIPADMTEFNSFN